MVSREEALRRINLARETVDIPEWGGPVIVRGMTGTERDAFEASMTDGSGRMVLHNFRAKLVCFCVINENGDRVFQNGDEKELGNQPAGILSAIAEVAMRLSGLTKADREEMVKNSMTAPSDDSTSS